MSAALPVTLQINLAPSDHRLAGQLLAHQLRFWQQHVQEVLLVIDENRPRGRFSADWDNGRESIWKQAEATGAKVIAVDYEPAAMSKVAERFFSTPAIPRKDFRGGPYYSYFFGLHAATQDFVLHCDSDIFFGGEGGLWLQTAVDLLNRSPNIAFTAPLPGPPSADGRLLQLKATPCVIAEQPGHMRTEMSTRVFLFNRSNFRARVGPLTPTRPGLRQQFLALVDGNPPRELPEKIITQAMERRSLQCFNFLGHAPGCWTLHPPYRCRDFFEKLPQLIERVEQNDLPAAQLGDHDFNASLVDWSEAIAAMRQRRWWRRLGQRWRRQR